MNISVRLLRALVDIKNNKAASDTPPTDQLIVYSRVAN
jgi:hypothetical protein